MLYVVIDGCYDANGGVYASGNVWREVCSGSWVLAGRRWYGLCGEWQVLVHRSCMVGGGWWLVVMDSGWGVVDRR